MNNKNSPKLKLIKIIFNAFIFIFSFQGQTFGFNVEKEDLGKEYSIYIIQEFWHTGIIFQTKDVNPNFWPEIKNHKQNKYVDVGWGDEKFYQVHGFPFFLAARAILWPTQSVLRVFPFNNPIKTAYDFESRILKIPLNSDQFSALTLFISESYKPDENGNPQTSTAYGANQYYFLANRKYHLFQTCNTWVAIALKNAGIDIRSFLIINANQLFRQISRLPGAEFIDRGT